MNDPNSISLENLDARSPAAFATMAARERRVMELLKSTAPERIEHDLRNVLNELGLLRVLFDRIDETESKSE